MTIFSWLNFGHPAPPERGLRLGEIQNSKWGSGAKNFAPPQTPFPRARDRQNLISCRWSLPLSTIPIWSMYTISTYRVTHKQTQAQNPQQTGPITKRCTAASAQCNEMNILWFFLHIFREGVRTPQPLDLRPWLRFDCNSTYMAGVLPPSAEASIGPNCMLCYDKSMNKHFLDIPSTAQCSVTVMFRVPQLDLCRPTFNDIFHSCRCSFAIMYSS